MLPLTWDQGPRAAAEEEAGGQEPSESHLRIKKYTRVSKRGTREMINEGSVGQRLKTNDSLWILYHRLPFRESWIHLFAVISFSLQTFIILLSIFTKHRSLCFIANYPHLTSFYASLSLSQFTTFTFFCLYLIFF